jgi:autotransporter family porin
MAVMMAVGIGALALGGAPALASECNLATGAPGSGTPIANGGECGVPPDPNYSPVRNDGLVGSARATGGDTITFKIASTANIAIGSSGLQDLTYGSLRPDLNLNELIRLDLGAQTQSISTSDPITQGNVTVATYNSNNFSASDWGSATVRAVGPVGNNQYINARFGTAEGGTMNVDVGGSSDAPLADGHDLTMVIKQTYLAAAIGEGSTVNWQSRNQTSWRADTPASNGSATITVAQYKGPVTFKGVTYNVTDEASLAQYNEALIAALRDNSFPLAGQTPQAAYNSAFNAAVSFADRNVTWTYNFPTGDEALEPRGDYYAILVDGAGAVGHITSTGQIDGAGNAVLARNGGHFEIDAGGRLSVRANGLVPALVINTGGSAVNNGVIGSGYWIGDNLDTATADASEFGDAAAVNVDGRPVGGVGGASFTNNGIINVAASNVADAGENGYGFILRGGTGINVTGRNTGIINVGVNNNSTSRGITNGVFIDINNRGGSFTNEEGGLIYIGRAAQYNVANPEAVPDTENNVVQYGVSVGAGVVLNKGEIVIGSRTQNATALFMVPDGNTNNGKNMRNDVSGTISILGQMPGGLQNVGMYAADTTGQTLNAGLIELTGTNAVALKVMASAGERATSATHGGTIDVLGGVDAQGLRNYGIWAEGANATVNLTPNPQAGGAGNGVVNLEGEGAIGVHARNGATINMQAGAAGVNFVSGAGQIGFFTYGTGSSITNASGAPLDVGTENSTLFRIEDGASYSGADENLTASGAGSTLLIGSGAGTTVTTNTSTFHLTGAGSTGVKIDGGATGTVSAGTTIDLAGNGAVGGLVDGRKIDLAGNASGAYASILTNEAALSSSAINGVGFITQYGGTLNNNGEIDLNGDLNFGIIARSGGILHNTANVTVANGVALLVEGAGSASQLSNSAALTAKDGIAAIEVIDGATLNGDASTGAIIADGTADGVLIAAAGPDPQNPSVDLSAGAGAALGANTITVNGSGNGVENAAEVSAVSFVGTVINTTGSGAAIRTATSFTEPPASTATLNVTGAGTGFLFQQANGTAATGGFTLGTGYVINVTGTDGTGIHADTTGAVNIASTVDVRNAAGGSALKLGAGVTTATLTGSLSSTSATAPTVDYRAATGPATFTNTGTVANTSVAPIAIAMASDGTVNVGAPGDNGVVDGTILFSGGANNVLITGGTAGAPSSVSRVESAAAGSTTVTVRGADNTFGVLSGTVGSTDTLVFDNASYTLSDASRIVSYDQVNLINGSAFTLQTALGGDPAGGAGIDVSADSLLAIAPVPSAAFTLTNELTGAGLATVNLGDTGNKFDFAATVGSAFAGTVILGPGTMDETPENRPENRTALTNATLRVDEGGRVNAGLLDPAHPIGGLQFNGGTVFFDVQRPDILDSEHEVTVSQTMDLSGLGKVMIDNSNGFANAFVELLDPQVDVIAPILEQDNGNGRILLARFADTSHTVEGTAGGLDLVDTNETLIGKDTRVPVNIIQTGFVRDVLPGDSPAAVGIYNVMLQTSRFDDPDNHDGLYLGYGLKEVHLKGKDLGALTLTPDTGASGADADLQAWVTGAGDLAIDAGKGNTVSLSDPANNYTGTTFVRSGTLATGADTVLGQADSHTELLDIAPDATVRLSAGLVRLNRGTTQIVGALNARSGATLDLAGGTLTIANDGNGGVSDAAAGSTLMGAGQLNLERGRFDVAGTNANLQANVNIASGATANLDGAAGLGNLGTTTVAGVLNFNGAAGDLRKTMAGAGAVNLNGVANLSIAATASNDGFTGTWNLAPGTTLRVGPAASAATQTVFGSASTVNVAQNALFDIGGASQTIGALNNNAGGMVRIASADASANANAPLATLKVGSAAAPGVYQGGGTVVLSTQLGGDASPTDRLEIHGEARGSTNLQIVQRPGSAGAQTGVGIKVVDIEGTSSATFGLAGPGVVMLGGDPTIAAGAYVYRLKETGNGGDPNDWYLVSSGGETPPPGPEGPEPPPGGERPEVGSYLDNRYLALASQFHTLHDRQGQAPGIFEQPGVAPPDDPDANSWIRVQGGYGKRNTDSFRNADHSYLLHLGSDLARWKVGEEGSLRLGVMGLAMHGDGRTRAPGLDSSSHSVHGLSAGVYATWYGGKDMLTGPYADAWALFGSFDNTVRGRGEEKYSARAFTISLEAGYGFQVGEKREAGRVQRLIVQPQAQVAWSDYRAGNHTEGVETFNTVVSRFKHSEPTTRLGLRLYTDDQWDDSWTQNVKRRTRPFVEANWLHGKGSHAIAFDGETVRDDLPANRGEFKVGIEGNLSRNLTAWGYGGIQTTFNSRYNNGFMSLGLRYGW